MEEGWSFHQEIDEMADYPVRAHSKRQIKDAGKRLRERGLPYTEDVVHAFRVAHNWRVSHAYPMVQERKVLARIAGSDADTAGRIKRMDSIRKKLRRSPLRLTDIQDFAGVRAIVADMSEVRRIEAWYLEASRSDRVRRVDDYVSHPKPGGYRSLHIVRRYDGVGASWRGQKVEVQVRTRLQHIWATAVEAVGAMRGEDLKAGEGCADWLRLLEIMSGHMAEIEGQYIGSNIPVSAEARRRELHHLNKRLGAIEKLSAYRTVVRKTGGAARFYLVALDTETGEVTVTPYRGVSDGDEAYFAQRDSGEGRQAVLVSVDGADALRRAYPNYFLDVGEFLRHLKDALGLLSFIDRVETGFLKNMR